MGIALFIMTIICIASISLNAMYHYDLKRITQQLKEVSETDNTNERIRTTTQLKRVNKITDGINQLIEQQIIERIRYKKSLQSQKEEWANVSHDLRTPLTSLRGYMEVIQKEDLSEADRKYYLSIMERKVDDLIERINVFYDVSLIESESIKIQREFMDINIIMSDVLLLYFKEIDSKNIIVEISEGMHEAYIDQQATFRIINNVIVNAVRFAERYINIQYYTVGDKLIVTIENDTSEDIKEPSRLFERSFMGDVSRQGAHNGLGLYIVKALMALQSGDARIEVSEGVFKMVLEFER
ncbi:histidine kinase dimerization/phospho-acceptor domain-containing protein [Macrococcus capreoli]|uniref:sensor histidine kinase n=1 Tax=Macrococcus capreoli TaxID=2982690 RepID=UPI003EE54097